MQRFDSAASMGGGFAPVMTAPALTVTEKRRQVIDALKGDTKVYKPLHQTELADLAEFRSRPTAGTILEPIVRVRGLEPTHGAVMDDLELTQGDLHALCDCHSGYTTELNGKQAVVRLHSAFHRQSNPDHH